MADEIQSENITISGAEDTGNQIKIKDQNRRTYSFFKTKKDGAPTEAYRNYQSFKVGDVALLTYKEVPYKDGTIKNVMTFKPATASPEPGNQQQSFKGKTGEKPGREYWEKREAKRQSSILMQVAFKSAVAMQAAKIQAGGEENLEDLYSKTLEFYDWMEDQIEDGEKPAMQKQTAATEAQNDEILS